MRAALIVLVACAPAPKPVPVPPISNIPAHSCGEAAERLEHATRDLREPEQSILVTMRGHCIDDRWQSVAIDCFAQMSPDDLGTCAGKLGPDQREAMFGAFGSSIAGSVAKLKALHVGIQDCDQLIGALVAVLTCDRLAFDQRVELGNGFADFWWLPDKLPASASARMATVCNHSLVELRAQVSDSGCMP